MRVTSPGRILYRVRQFGRAVVAPRLPVSAQDLGQAHDMLPPDGWRIFKSMPRTEQHHAMSVWRSIRARGYDQPEAAQAALLHDCAKHGGGVTLVHRVAAVLIKSFAPGMWRRLKHMPEPARRDVRFPLWVHANHPARSAAAAAAAVCLPGAVELIRRHQEELRDDRPPAPIDDLLAAFQAADDEN